jgi:sialidase-1
MNPKSLITLIVLLFFSSGILLAQSPANNYYHQLYDGLDNAQIRFESEKKGRVAFLGGSITYNPGWRDSISAYLVARFPETDFDFVEAGIPSMGSTPAAFRLEQDVLAKGRIDLLFEEAAVNDATNSRTAAEQIRALEGIVRHLRNSNPAMDIVLMHFVDPDKMKDYNQGIEPAVIRNHNQVGKHYRIPTINLAKEVTARINQKEFSWEADFINLHPSPFGQGIYARSMIAFLEQAFSKIIAQDDKITAHPLPAPLDEHNYNKGALLDVSTAKKSKNWSIDSKWQPSDGARTRPNFYDVPMLVGDTPGPKLKLKLKFKGTVVGIAVAAGPDAAMIEYRIDKKQWQQLNLSTQWSKHLHLPWFYTLVSELEPKKHLLEIRLAEISEDSLVEKACRIRYFYINEL